jgi:hypothetical protein
MNGYADRPAIWEMWIYVPLFCVFLLWIVGFSTLLFIDYPRDNLRWFLIYSAITLPLMTVVFLQVCPWDIWPWDRRPGLDGVLIRLLIVAACVAVHLGTLDVLADRSAASPVILTVTRVETCPRKNHAFGVCAYANAPDTTPLPANINRAHGLVSCPIDDPTNRERKRIVVGRSTIRFDVHEGLLGIMWEEGDCRISY